MPASGVLRCPRSWCVTGRTSTATSLASSGEACRMRRTSWSLLALVGALAMLMPFTAAASDLDRARERVDELQTNLIEVSDRYEQVMAEIEQLRTELDELADEERRLVERAQQIDERLSVQARQVYMHGAGSEFESLLAAEGPNVGVERASFFASIQQRESADLQDAVSLRTRLEQTRELMAQREEQLAERSVELEQMRELIETDLDIAEGEVATLEALASRQRQISAGGQQGTYACPLDPGVSHFIDSWGFPRSGGRSHKGTDIMGPMGVPVYAFTDGVISRHSQNRLGGTTLYLRGDDGSTYYYAHLQRFAPAGAVGNRVVAGELIAYNGDTGNARGGPPHVHFERHPGGGSAVNPYPWLARACF